MSKVLKYFNEFVKSGAKLFLSVEDLDDPKEFNRRWDICKKSCNSYDPKNDKCTVCGCFMEVKASLLNNRNPKKSGRVEQTHCPLAKWGDKEIANYYREMDGLPLIN